MKVFKIMGLYLLAAITLSACSKDATESTQIQENANSKIALTKALSYDYAYYNAAQAILADVESRGEPSFPLSAADWGHYQSLVGTELDMDLEAVNQIADQVFVMHQMGIKDYMNDKLELKEATQSMVMEIIEEGAIKNISRRASFRSLPEKEQQMLLGANAVARDYENNSKEMVGSNSRILVLNIIGAIGGVLTGVGVGYDLCGTACAIVGGIIGGVIGWFSGGVGK
jgi:hypothetical protein